MKHSYLPLGLSLCLLVSCQLATQTSAPAPRLNANPPQLSSLTTAPEAVPASELNPVSYTPKPAPFGKVTALPDQKLEVNFTYPQPQQFKTQAFGCGDVGFASIAVTGPALGTTTIYANGSDPVTHLFTANSCTISGVLDAVPYGDLVVTIRLYDNDGNLLAGSELQAGVSVNKVSEGIEMSYRQSNVGQILKMLQGGSIQEQFVASQLDLAAVQSFIDTLTGVQDQFPAYTFTTHPALVNIPAIVADLLANGGNIALLNPQNAAYKFTPGVVRFNLTGVLSGQSVKVSIDDAVSEDATVMSNGEVVFNNLPPGNYTIRLSGEGYLSQRIAVTVTEGQTTYVNPLVILPPQPTLTSLTPLTGVSGSSITITGTNFNAVAANNRVEFGTTSATVTNATATQLTVTVPAGLAAGSHAVSLRIGESQIVTGLSYTVLVPTITSLDFSEGEIGSQVIITGTNFNTVMANNTVKFGSAFATVTAATAIQLTVTVPAASQPTPICMPICMPTFPVPIFGNNPITVVNLQSLATAPQNFAIVPKISSLSITTGSSGDILTIIGNGFSIGGTGNTVQLGDTTFNNVIGTNTIMNTTLQVTVPNAAAGSTNATVAFGGQTSTAATFNLLPKLSSLTTLETTGNPAKAVLIRGETLTIAGSNFDTTKANNTVTFTLSNSTPVEVTGDSLDSVSASEITLKVPDGVDLKGDVTIQVTTNSQVSNSLTGFLAAIDLNLNVIDGGFH